MHGGCEGSQQGHQPGYRSKVTHRSHHVAIRRYGQAGIR
jgi:hypothetical protein